MSSGDLFYYHLVEAIRQEVYKLCLKEEKERLDHYQVNPDFLRGWPEPNPFHRWTREGLILVVSFSEHLNCNHKASFVELISPFGYSNLNTSYVDSLQQTTVVEFLNSSKHRFRLLEKTCDGNYTRLLYIVEVFDEIPCPELQDFHQGFFDGFEERKKRWQRCKKD